MRLIVNIAQVVGVVCLITAASLLATSAGFACAGVVLCALAWLHDPDRKVRR